MSGRSSRSGCRAAAQHAQGIRAHRELHVGGHGAPPPPVNSIRAAVVVPHRQRLESSQNLLHLGIGCIGAVENENHVERALVPKTWHEMLELGLHDARIESCGAAPLAQRSFAGDAQANFRRHGMIAHSRTFCHRQRRTWDTGTTDRLCHRRQLGRHHLAVAVLEVAEPQRGKISPHSWRTGERRCLLTQQKRHSWARIGGSVAS